MSKTLEELGYKIEVDNERYLAYSNGFTVIVFEKKPQSIMGFIDRNRCVSDKFNPFGIGMEELKAIYKYCEDNKWI